MDFSDLLSNGKFDGPGPGAWTGGVARVLRGPRQRGQEGVVTPWRHMGARAHRCSSGGEEMTRRRRRMAVA
jgi:hypothetical protein